ncbi:MFS transporter [Kineosporia babensis]|uniref:MFS transporter n=1 Tax=Kineosporia babensis TaxID=499548 RepID=A0A9X1NF02_9ACTN|nr:MFS transporter [Kineosporia babensis]MCD5312096.1 MFS transporter [Kineosporia babensis]
MSSPAWRRVAFAMFVIGWGGNQFTPLLLAYRSESGYSQLDVDIFLGAYVIGLIPGLLLASGLSDRHGRRPVLLAGLLASLLGSALLGLGDSLGYAGIFAGRALSGLAVGIAMAVGTSWITELAALDPTLAPGTGARRATIWLSSGFALGPASAGLLAQFTEPALVWPYLVHAVLCVPVILALLRYPIPTTEPGRTTFSALKHPRFLRVVVPMAPWIFGSAGVAYAVIPSLVSEQLGDWALLFTAALTVATLGTGVAVQPIARRLDDISTSRAITVSMLLMTAGMVLAAITAVVRSPWLAVPVALVLGAAYGIAVVSGLLEVQRIAKPGELVGLTGVYYALAYVGFLIPAALAAAHPWFGYPGMLSAVALICLLCTALCASGWSKHLRLEPLTVS